MIKISPFGAGSDKTEYEPYDKELPKIFEEIKALILQELPDVSVKHIGSSSIPGIGGRNVLDIAIPSSEEKHKAITTKLKQLGFENSPFPHYLPLLVATTTWNEKKYFILLYVLSKENPTFKDWLAFRNHMRQNPVDAKAYDEVKKKAIKEGNTEGDSYQKAKSPFLKTMLEKIKTN